MAEFIVQIEHPELCLEYGGTNYTERLECIVRCKDCKYLHEYEKKTWANNIPYKVQQCEYWADSTWGSVEIEPDGFCAWGERREDD